MANTITLLDCTGEPLPAHWIAEIAGSCADCDGIATTLTCRCMVKGFCANELPQNAYCLYCNLKRLREILPY